MWRFRGVSVTFIKRVPLAGHSGGFNLLLTNNRQGIVRISSYICEFLSQARGFQRPDSNKKSGVNHWWRTPLLILEASLVEFRLLWRCFQGDVLPTLMCCSGMKCIFMTCDTERWKVSNGEFRTHDCLVGV